MLGNIDLKLKLWARSRYVLAAREMMRGIGLKYVKLLVYERTLDKEIIPVSTKVPVEVKLLTATDVRGGHYTGVRLASGDDLTSHDETLRRLDSGDVCFVSVLGNKVAAVSWIYLHESKYESIVDREMRIADDGCLVYDAYTWPELRHNGLIEKTTEQILMFVKSIGLSKVCAYMESDNVGSIKTAEAFGCSCSGDVTYLRIFGFKRVKEHWWQERQ